MLLGHSLDRPRLVGPAAIAFEITGSRGRWLLLGAHRRHPVLTLLERADLPQAPRDDDADDATVPGTARQALLLFRKHAAGPRIHAVDAVPGEPFVVISAGSVRIALRMDQRPALSLVVGEEVLASIGQDAAWPVPRFPEESIPSRGDRGISPEASRDPAESPMLVAARPFAELDDRDAAESPVTVATAGETPAGAGRVATAFTSWLEATAAAFRLRQRGERFAAQRRSLRDAITRDQRRKTTLQKHLTQDLAKVEGADALRRTAEALLAAPSAVPGKDGVAAVPDPYEPQTVLRIPIDPALGPRGTADRLYERARRLAKARAALVQRLADTEAAREALARRGQALENARSIADLQRIAGGSETPAGKRHAAAAAKGPLRYLTTRGLTLWAGRGARENHELTFGKARPDDLWFHVRDRPGAHVILVDNEGRATADDQREAAEVAAFLSDAKDDGAVDVHTTRRKHLRSVKGSPGRVVIGYSETLRVAPRDPEGRLRRR